ncbi:Hypothetical protein SRAE_1000342300 [Strongyloides ratti]|uniref:Uncharacterized protein n=1 Tax=Strongyloides ratti TaxID=34506 RepID=A0A090LCD9_STRRB|nr:Hypothetical protein SRAE_1000342300 [Strongyloides ratti]CEF65170.1 Hypothetical protein SRAE_1000342300 [Strongyloides ratti]
MAGTITNETYFYKCLTNPNVQMMMSFYLETPEVVHYEIEIKLLKILKESKKSVIRLIDIPNYVMKCLDISFPFKEFIFNNEQRYWIYYLQRLIIDEYIYGLGDLYFIDGFHIFDNFLIPSNNFNEKDTINQINIINGEENNDSDINFFSNVINTEDEGEKKINEVESWYQVIDSLYSKKLSNKFCPTKTIFDKYLEENKARRNNDLINQLNIICKYNDKENGVNICGGSLNIASNINGTPLTPDYHLYENSLKENEKQLQLVFSYSMLYPLL